MKNKNYNLIIIMGTEDGYSSAAPSIWELWFHPVQFWYFIIFNCLIFYVFMCRIDVWGMASPSTLEWCNKDHIVWACLLLDVARLPSSESEQTSTAKVNDYCFFRNRFHLVCYLNKCVFCSKCLISVSLLILKNGDFSKCDFSGHGLCWRANAKLNRYFVRWCLNRFN